MYDDQFLRYMMDNDGRFDTHFKSARGLNEANSLQGKLESTTCFRHIKNVNI